MTEKYLCVKIENFTSVITGGTPSTSVKEYWENGTIPWLNSGDLNQDIITFASNYITEEGLKNSSTRLMPPDTVLIALTGATTGKTALLTFESCANQSVTGILPSDYHLPKYLYYYLQTLREKILKISWGGAQKHINQAYVKNLKISLPSLSEQKQIVEILDKADSIRQKRKQAINLLDEYLRSTFLDMFGDPYINNKKLVKKQFGDFIEYIGDIGSNGSNETVAKNLIMSDKEDYAIMIRTVNLNSNNFYSNLKYVSKKTYDFFSKSKIYGGEIIMNKIGSAGEFWIMPHLGRPVSLGLNQLVIRLKNLNTIYTYYYFSTKFGRNNIKSRVRGSTTKSITKLAVKELPLLYPSIKLQNQFAEIVKKVESVKYKMQESLKEMDNYFNSLLNKFFGKY